MFPLCRFIIAAALLLMTILQPVFAHPGPAPKARCFLCPAGWTEEFKTIDGHVNCLQPETQIDCDYDEYGALLQDPVPNSECLGTLAIIPCPKGDRVKPTGVPKPLHVPSAEEQRLLISPGMRRRGMLGKARHDHWATMPEDN